jgi:hypothetical protein
VYVSIKTGPNSILNNTLVFSKRTELINNNKVTRIKVTRIKITEVIRRKQKPIKIRINLKLITIRRRLIWLLLLDYWRLVI